MKNFPISRQKFLMTYFLVIDHVFQILRFFTLLNVVYDPFFTRKTTISYKNSLIRPFFFTLFVLSRASDNATSLNIGGTNAWAVPTSNFGGDRPPVPLRSPPLNLCMIFFIRVHLCMHVWSFNVKFQSVYICLCLYA